jgi:ABC-type uncharacterized transport system permease subunit
MNELAPWLIPFLASTLRVSTPLIFAAMGGVVSERAGVINIALEGIMLIGAFSSAVAAHSFQSLGLGVCFGLLVSVLFTSIYAFCALKLESDQIVAGTAMNLLAAGLTPFLSKVLYDSTTATPTLPAELRFEFAPLLMAWVVVLALAWIFARLPIGLWIRFAGEHPEALETAGVRSQRVRWFAVLFSGVLAGMGGISLSLYLSSSFARGMTAGRGFMALAAMIFGKWKPVPAALACLLFGLAEAAQMRLQGVALFGEFILPVQWIQALPYLFTIVVLAGWVGTARAPKALGLLK